jgi:molybdenum cofactor cytidylyltransferase
VGADHKLLAPWRGRPLVRWALEHAAEAGLARTWVVTGAIDLAAAGAVPPDVEVLANERWAEGQATSLHLAISAAGGAGLDAVVVGLGDQPLVPASAWRAVAAARERPIAVATYGGRRGNPVRLDRSVWELVPTEGDEGARVLMRERPDLVMAVACEGDPLDIDTVEDLSTWN